MKIFASLPHYSWLFACATAQKMVPLEPHLITSTSTEQNGTETALTVTPVSKPNSDSNVRMENENVEEEPGDNHPLAGVVVCFNKKMAAQESKHL